MSLASCASTDDLPKSRFKMRQNSKPHPDPALLRWWNILGPMRSNEMLNTAIESTPMSTPGVLVVTSTASVIGSRSTSVQLRAECQHGSELAIMRSTSSGNLVKSPSRLGCRSSPSLREGRRRTNLVLVQLNRRRYHPKKWRDSLKYHLRYIGRHPRIGRSCGQHSRHLSSWDLLAPTARPSIAASPR